MFIHPSTALVLSCVVIVLGETGGRDREIERDILRSELSQLIAKQSANLKPIYAPK